MHLKNEIRRRPTGINVPDDERVTSTVLGAGALLLARRQGGLLGILLGAGGIALAARGITGRCATTRALALGEGVEARKSVTILRPRREVYELWRRLENLPRFLEHVKSVREIDDRRSHWVVQEGPFSIEWDAEIIDDIPDVRIAWQSIEGSLVEHAGRIELRDAPGGRGTEVHVMMAYRPPGGVLVAAPLRGLLRRFTRHQLGIELARLRQLMETGEVATGARTREELDGGERKTLRAIREVEPPLEPVAPHRPSIVSPTPTGVS